MGSFQSLCSIVSLIKQSFRSGLRDSVIANFQSYYSYIKFMFDNGIVFQIGRSWYFNSENQSEKLYEAKCIYILIRTNLFLKCIMR